jgi:hypothetical protein
MGAVARRNSDPNPGDRGDDHSPVRVEWRISRVDRNRDDRAEQEHPCLRNDHPTCRSATLKGASCLAVPLRRQIALCGPRAQDMGARRRLPCWLRRRRASPGSAGRSHRPTRREGWFPADRDPGSAEPGSQLRAIVARHEAARVTRDLPGQPVRLRAGATSSRVRFFPAVCGTATRMARRPRRREGEVAKLRSRVRGNCAIPPAFGEFPDSRPSPAPGSRALRLPIAAQGCSLAVGLASGHGNAD